MKTTVQFQLTFSQAWVLTQRESDMLPVDWFVSEIMQRYQVSKLKSRLTECQGLIEMDPEIDEGILVEQLKELIEEKYDFVSGTELYTIEVNSYEATDEETSESGVIAKENEQPSKKPDEQSNNKTASLTILEKINALVGASEIKELANECSKIAESLIQNQIVDAFTSRAYIISINQGYGLTTYLELLADLIHSLGLFEITSKNKVVEVALDSPDAKYGDEAAFASVLSSFQGRGKGKIVCIDISEWMSKLDDRKFKDFLRAIEGANGENIVFFRVPYVERSIISEIKEHLNDVLYVKTLSIPPFNNQELMQCAEKLIKEKGFSVKEEAWDVFQARIAAEKSDGRFYGINTIRKVIREMLYIKQTYNVDNGLSDKEIHRDEIVSLVDDELLTEKSGLEQLNELVGMNSICEKVKEVIAQIEAAHSNHALDMPCIHMRFVGNPGTGKTTVARIIGTILKEKGILRNGNFFEHSGRELCGRYVGETAPKTSAMCRDAYGSVLFIDEAYSLYRDDGFSNADYGREAIDTLIAEMENHRSDLMVIMAGYPDDMDKLMNGNAGLKSRMPYLIEFPNYARGQLAEIFLSMAGKSFTYDTTFADAVNSYFSSLSEKILTAKDFSNARFVRNLFERTWGKAALRCQLDEIECNTLLVEDFALAASDKEFHNIMEQKKRTIGFN